jgi:sulfatase maturation enzyme AslB (radical SAM superfamily)
MIVDPLKLFKFVMSNPLSRKIMLTSLSKEYIGSNSFGSTLETHVNFSGRYRLNQMANRINAFVLRKILDLGSEAFGVDCKSVREFLQNPITRRGLVSVLKGVTKYRLTKPQIIESPFLVVWNFTNLCNLRCRHCCQNAGKLVFDELSLQEKIDVVHKLADAGVVSIALSGGEPLMHSHFFPILKEISQREMYPAVATNGTLITKKMANRLKKWV